MIKLGIVGYGYWGKNLINEFNRLSDAKIMTICDLSADQLAFAKRDYPNINVTSDYKAMIHDNNIDAIIIATPIATHYKLALAALNAGKHVLVEKPLATHVEQALSLQEVASKKHAVVMVDYTPVYSSAVQELHHLIEKRELGEIAYFDSIRTNFGTNDFNSSIIWDLAIHDFALINYLFAIKPVAVSAVGSHYLNHRTPDIAYITLFFNNNIIAHVQVNSLAPEKMRRITIAGSKKMVVYDDCLVDSKVRVFDKGIEYFDKRITDKKASNEDTIHLVKAKHNDALTSMAKHFVDCIDHHLVPQTNCQTSIPLVHMLEAAERSLKMHGATVELNRKLV